MIFSTKKNKVMKILKKCEKKFEITKLICRKGNRKTAEFNKTHKIFFLMKKGDDPTILGNIKYAMGVKWSNKKNCIIIGQNPSLAKQNSTSSNFIIFDDTNFTLMKILDKLGYGSYIMINTFPNIIPNGNKITSISSCKDNIDISNYIISKFKTKILACTITNNISLEYYNETISIIKKINILNYKGKNLYHFATRTVYRIVKHKHFQNISIKKIKKINTQSTNEANNTIKIKDVEV